MIAVQLSGLFGSAACLTSSSSFLHPQEETLVAARQRGGTAFGTSTALEKQYLRLTAAPAANTVRPPHVLERALPALKDKWLQVCCNALQDALHNSRQHHELLGTEDSLRIAMLNAGG